MSLFITIWANTFKIYILGNITIHDIYLNILKSPKKHLVNVRAGEQNQISIYPGPGHGPFKTRKNTY